MKLIGMLDLLRRGPAINGVFRLRDKRILRPAQPARAVMMVAFVTTARWHKVCFVQLQQFRAPA
jgi:hypothetical protein